MDRYDKPFYSWTLLDHFAEACDNTARIMREEDRKDARVQGQQ